MKNAFDTSGPSTLFTKTELGYARRSAVAKSTESQYILVYSKAKRKENANGKRVKSPSN